MLRCWGRGVLFCLFRLIIVLEDSLYMCIIVNVHLSYALDSFCPSLMLGGGLVVVISEVVRRALSPAGTCKIFADVEGKL